MELEILPRLVRRVHMLYAAGMPRSEGSNLVQYGSEIFAIHETDNCRLGITPC